MLGASDGRWKETSGPSFSMKESGFAVGVGVAVADDMIAASDDKCDAKKEFNMLLSC